MISLMIIGKRWFRKGPGTTYFSAVAFADGKAIARIDYAYGYGNQYEDSMFLKLDHDGLLPFPVKHHESAWRYCERHGITYNAYAIDVQRKKDL